MNLVLFRWTHGSFGITGWGWFFGWMVGTGVAEAIRHRRKP